MKNKLLMGLSLVIMSITAVLVYTKLAFHPKGVSTNLVSPGEIVTTPSPTSSPVSIKFDRNTDLKKELEKVDPKINDSDF